MLRSLGKVSLFLRFRRWVCVCMRAKLVDPQLLERVRSWKIAGFVCWCDASDSAR